MAMLRFLLRRVGQGLLVLWLITMLVFGIFFIAPNDVARTLAGRQATPQTVNLISERLGLNQPIWQQYGRFIWRAVHGDLGFDYYHGRRVTSVIVSDIPPTLSLALGAAVLALVLGVFSGVVAGRRPGSVADRFLTVLAVVFYSMPAFLLAVVLLYFLYFRLTGAGLAWFPAGGYVSITESPWQWLRHMILPWLTLALVYAATYTRLTRSSMLDVAGEDYIRTARAKGITERRVIYRHALRSGVTPVVTQFGIDLGALIGGAVLVETVFSISGLGRESVTAINQQNQPIIIGIVLFASAAVIVANILVDVAYAMLDPRVRLH
jgi:peptide/nickel transport system permease protein